MALPNASANKIEGTYLSLFSFPHSTSCPPKLTQRELEPKDATQEACKFCVKKAENSSEGHAQLCTGSADRDPPTRKLKVA